VKHEDLSGAGMARKLRTFITSSGFFDLAVAAPTKKAAVEAWGTHPNVFRDGFAKETDDPDVVAVTMAKPGAVLRRAVGSANAFKVNAKLPRTLSIPTEKKAPTKRPKAKPPRKVDDELDRKAASAFKREAERRERNLQKEEAALEKQRQRRADTTDAAQLALDEAARRHESEVSKLDKKRAKIDARLQAEKLRWEKQREKLEQALRRASNA